MVYLIFRIRGGGYDQQEELVGIFKSCSLATKQLLYLLEQDKGQHKEYEEECNYRLEPHSVCVGLCHDYTYEKVHCCTE